MTRPFRFALQAMKAGSAAEWTTLARRTEELGYSTLFLADHYLGKGPALEKAPQPLQHLAPIAAMAAAAAVTKTLRVGSRVFCVDYHIPAVLAKEAATLDLLSDGRMEFGIGAGWNGVEYEAMGLAFGAPADRVSKLEEVVALFKAQCGGEPLDRDGAHVTATGYAGLPITPQRPHPPVMVGGARKRVLSFAARDADIVSINNVDFTAVTDEGLSPHEEAQRRLGYVLGAGGDRVAHMDIESSPFFTKITDDVAAATEPIAGMLGVEPSLLLDHPNALFGSVEAIVDLLLERRETYGVNYVTVQQGELEQFAPVVARLSGA